MCLGPRGVRFVVHYPSAFFWLDGYLILIGRVIRMLRRIGVVGIVIEDRKKAPEINSILSSYADIIIGRMGIPNKETGISVISLIVQGTNDEIGAMTGKLGNIKEVQVKSALSNKC